MKQVFEQVSRTLLCGVSCFSSIIAFATPTISDLKVASIEPLGVAIDYTVSGATEDDVTPLFVSLSANGTNCVAQTLSGATNCVNGSHRVYWNMAKDGLSLDPMTAFLTVAYEYPLYCVIDLAGGSATNVYPITYMNTEPEDGFNTTGYKTTKLVLKRVDAGTFIMGDDQTNESHRVTLTKPFYMGLFEVTQKQWELVMGSNPCSSTSYGKGAAHPVYYVSYDAIRGSSTGAKWPATNSVDSTSFLGKLRTKTMVEIDLPTEAQWEYTCRAGTTTAYSYGDNVDGDCMWCKSNSSSKVQQVGTKIVNPWGFYDMHGNVRELCLDWYNTLLYGTDPKGSSWRMARVTRGGSWCYDETGCTSSYRSYMDASCPCKDIGLRLSWTLPLIDEMESASATVEVALRRICADGSSVDGKRSLGYAPSKIGNTIVAINNEVLLNASEAGSWMWTAQTAGVYAVSHTVGDDVMSASYVVTNGYAKVSETPNPPMELVAGITLSPSGEVSVAAKKTRQLIRISGNGEAWTGETSAEWLTLNYTNGMAQGDSIVCTVSENVDADARVGYAYIAGQTLKMTQAGRGATVDGSVVADGAGGEIVVAITVAEGTTWSASSECPWIAVSSQNGTGSGEVVLNVLPWNNAVPRVGTVTIAGQTVTVTQNAAQFVCLTGTETNVVANGASGALEIVATRGVVWSATSDAVWLVVAEDSEMRRGSGMIFWTAQPQSTTESRMATITVTAGELDGGRALTFTVTQAAARVELSAASVEVVAQGKTLSVDVATADGVEWSIADVPDWIALDGDEARRGADTVTFVVSPNTTFEERAATIVIAGKEFVVTQNAAKVEIEGGAIRCCTTAGIEALIATVRVDVATASWKVEISKDAKNWVFFIESSEDVPGDGTFELYVIPAEDGDTLPRTATVTVGNATLTIVQDDRVAIDDGYMSFFIPTSWFAQYPTLGGSTVAEWQTIAEGDGVKTNASGAAMSVWHDYVAGTDPTNALSKFTAKIEMMDGAPVVTWSPALNGEGVREGARVYRVWGKANLDDAAWSEVGAGDEGDFRFFRVTVEMP